MKYTMSPNIAVRTPNKEEAINFYSKVLGFAERASQKEYADLDAKPINLFIINDDDVKGPVMELFVDNLEEAKEELVANGCKVIKWLGKGQDCYIQDPFGVIFNIWETKE